MNPSRDATAAGVSASAESAGTIASSSGKRQRHADAAQERPARECPFGDERHFALLI